MLVDHLSYLNNKNEDVLKATKGVKQSIETWRD